MPGRRAGLEGIRDNRRPFPYRAGISHPVSYQPGPTLPVDSPAPSVQTSQDAGGRLTVIWGLHG